MWFGPWFPLHFELVLLSQFLLGSLVVVVVFAALGTAAGTDGPVGIEGTAAAVCALLLEEGAPSAWAIAVDEGTGKVLAHNVLVVVLGAAVVVGAGGKVLGIDREGVVVLLKEGVLVPIGRANAL